MEKIAALMMVFGIGCHMMKPKGVWTNCIWIMSTFTAVTVIYTARYDWDYLWQTVRVSAAILFLFIELGFVSLIRELRNCPDE